MELCIWGLSWFSCGIIGLFKMIFGLFLPGISGPIFFFVTLVISSITIYILSAVLGKTGGVILMVVGIIGALVSAGTTLILTLIGFIMTFFGKSKLLVLLNLGLFALCAACYGIG